MTTERAIPPMNRRVAVQLEGAAKLLGEQGANPFRVRAYQRGAETLRELSEPVGEILLREGRAGLDRLPGIGEGLARAIEAVLLTGRLPMLERMRGEADPEQLLASVPGIGKVLAERLHRELGLDTLEDLEAAAHDGRLARLARFGEKKVAGIRDSLATRLGRRQRSRPVDGEPSVEEILAVDQEYRERAAKGELQRIAPKRFNPERRAWLPVLHTTRGDRHYTALFSNTARAYELGTTRDWVVIYQDGGSAERQWTVITAQQGRFVGRRVVRGREDEMGES